MANRTLFKSWRGRQVPPADARNEAGGVAYALTPRHALAQYAATGCLHGTFYAAAREQLGVILSLCEEIDGEFIARTALYAREAGFMKDAPALLCAVLSTRSPELLAQVFQRVIDNGRMVRTFVQIMRSGAVGRKSLGSRPAALIREWFACRSESALLRASVGANPSLADVIRMVHPKPESSERSALYGYLIGREVDTETLPALARQYEAFKADPNGEVPDVPFTMLTALGLERRHWLSIARRAPWQTTRMNLNTFARHGVFDDAQVVSVVAERLRDPDAIAKARVFPYQLMVAFRSADRSLPDEIRAALQDAMEIATANVPEVNGRVFVCPDVSGSMSSPVTGYRRGGTTAVRCVDVASLVAAALLRRNRRARVLPFHWDVVDVALNPRDSVMRNADVLSRNGGGGTNCSAPLAQLNKEKAKGDLVIYVSDNESWVDSGCGRGTALLQEWNTFRQRNPRARLVCIDIQPYRTVQAPEREDVLNVGGFSDAVFSGIARFAEGGLAAGHWVSTIESVDLN